MPLPVRMRSCFRRVTADADGNFAYELTAENLSSLGEGENKAIRATQTDAAGNSETTQLLTFAVDTTLSPQLSITSVGGDDSIVSGKSGDNQIVGVGEAGATVELFAVTGRDEILLLGETTSDADGNFVYELTAENLSSLGKVRIKRLEQRRLTLLVIQKPRSCSRLQLIPSSAHSFRLRLSVETMELSLARVATTRLLVLEKLEQGRVVCRYRYG